MKAEIILKCDGRTEKGLVFCSGVENVILDLEAVKAHENYTKLLEYLNNIARIFEAPCFKQNTISNTLHKIYEFGFLEEGRYNHIFRLVYLHRPCGLSLLARLKEKE